MRLAFVDPINWDYTVQSAYEHPMGGSQSALCYLAEALVNRGHEVFTFTNTTHPQTYRGVTCMALQQTSTHQMRAIAPECCIILNLTHFMHQLVPLFGLGPRFVLWTQHACDQPAVAALAEPAVCEAYDAFVFVSDWQRDGYLTNFPIAPEQTVVLRNAIAPAFERLFAPDANICAAKSTPIELAYTSTPFRGLDILVEVFPYIRDAIPGTTLKVFSSMGVYQVPREADESEFGGLYQACRDTDGIQYIGSVSQPQLAEELRSVAMLAYPNTFAETSCIAVMEAMAAGCGVLTSHLGALPETTSGFGYLVSHDQGLDAYKEHFKQTAIDFLHRFQQLEPSFGFHQTLRQQVLHANREYTWARRAVQWETYLNDLVET
ncbi:MAG: hypothetical protein ETSY2_34165 [Candidatus Entotheonella gemina]|uniref:Glycosyl transferase family 1 domain-containing protein n=1 Tax=Candidatus Entotheonella gemina TaxID=1429439 RepID=W4LYT3_9BACT|nr:MAG: hypothetical protein ETSY2_34165 [Candidatus Entotheonella gemina]